MSATDIRKIINLLESIVDETVDKIEVKHQDGSDVPFDSGTAFGSTDRYLLQNAEHLARIEKALSRVDHKFEIYFINHNKFNADHRSLRYGEREEAEDDELDRWEQTADKIQSHKLDLEYGIGNDNYDGVDPVPGKIVVLIYGNLSTYHQPMTPWIVAHKIAHAWCDCEGSNGSSIPDEFYKYYKKLKHLITEKTGQVYPTYVKKTLFKKEKNQFYNLLSTKSGRLKQNYHVSDDEALVEMVTQYLINGKVRFNLTDVPLAYHNGMLQIQKDVNELLNQVFKSMEGHIVISA